ncbi:MAG: hypothetical protein OXG26_04705 [Caldilineaceae bacterium]|nr:hypothetical protein [Caldilineaceae bacterium]MDE0633858.1 hypothetical protein [Caldilineaceae bacterium]
MNDISMNGKGPGEAPLQYRLDDEQYEELVDNVAGERVMGLALWEESVSDEGGRRPSPELRELFDLDLYLECNLMLALFGTAIYTDPESSPLRGWQQAGKIMQTLINNGIWLDEIAATEEDELVLILSRNHEPRLYLNVSGWTVEAWETLPGEQ